MNAACREPGSALPGLCLRCWTRASRSAIFVLALTLMAATSSNAVAQGTAGGTKIEERGPEIFLLPIKDGSIAEGGPFERVLDFPADSFRIWYKDVYRNTNPKDLPKYSLETVSTRIDVEGTNALLHVTYEVTPHASGWVRIPLGLHHAIFRSDVEVSPELPIILDRPQATTKSDGYALWCQFPVAKEALLSPLEPEPILLKVVALLPLTTRGEETSLETTLPADTKCQVTLDIPQPGANVSYKGSMVPKTLTETPLEEHSMHQYEFAGGPLSFNWRFDDQAMREQPVTLKVKGQLLANVETEQLVTTTARLQVESTTIPFDSFEVEIDDDAEFVPPTMPTVGYSVKAMEPTGQTFGNRLLVELDEATKGPVTISITTKQTDPVPGERGKRQFTVGQFDVVGCDVQDGTLSISASQNVHVQWYTPRNLREQSGRGSDGMSYRASFSYDQQPATLVMHTLPIQSTARVKSDYELHVGKLDAQLVATLSYRLPRSYTDDLLIDLNGWTVDRVDTNGAATWQPTDGTSDQLVLPLTAETGGEAMTTAPYRTIVVTVRAHRDHQTVDPAEISLPWIVPLAEPFGSATVTAIPDNDLEIRFQSEKSQGFQLDRSRSQEVELSGERGTIILRAAPTEQELRLGLQLTPVVPRLIVGSKVNVKLVEGQDYALVQQEFLYEPFHSSPSKAVFHLPTSIYFFQVTVAKINDKEVAGQALGQGDEQTIQFSLTEANPPYRIKVEYNAPLRETIPESGHYEMDLMSPKSEDLTKDGIDVDFKPLEVTFQSPHEVEVLSTTEDWRSLSMSDQGQTFQLPGGDTRQVEFAAPFLTPETDDRVVVDFHWLQVALTPEERRDRAAYTLRTSAPRLEVTLPRGVRDVEAYWNGVEMQATLNESKLQFDIPQRHESGRDRLELWYKYGEGDGMASSLNVSSPVITNAVLGTSQPGREGGYSYLQIVSPGNWLVLSAPGLSEEMDWSWEHGAYRRSPRLNQNQLETMAKSNAKSELPKGMNRALYSTIGSFENVPIRAAKISYLMLLFSGFSLAALLVLFYVPQTRHVLVFGVAAIVALAVAVAYPDFAMLVGEMSIVGIMLAILGIALYRLASSRTPVKSAVRARSSSDSQASVPNTSASASQGPSAGISTTSMPATAASSGQSR